MFGLRGIGIPELLIVLVIVVLIFGTSKLSGVGGALGTSIREFRKALSDGEDAEVEPAPESENKEVTKT
ncbi:MAG: twin-arginine translocase TatA/TatE family subunit [Anaerolineae bacterium]|nr:twin-arginine translocase TatA/TatE family subunit [Anaerolineae bacterium]MCB0199877.1 twin-arginine translocase TatA/TatE family subunit [Anaerolineae bacterium]MCB0204115.1 twin-arginine translocase TatA/TatE family subunit [Anaerolineae bacterium]MCB0256304.1 twin-arginine translocase TatA/TatE family subunit [Anaerolineae bacterium]